MYVLKNTYTHKNSESNQEPFDCMTAKTCTEPRDYSLLYKKAIFLTLYDQFFFFGNKCIFLKFAV